MKRVAIIADTHADETKRFEEHNRIMSWIADDIAARGVDLVVHAGDIWERRSTSAERRAVADWVTSMAEHSPIVLVTGNHDDPADVLALARLRTRNKVHAFDRPATLSIAGIALAALPWPRKANLLAAIGPGVGHEEAEQSAIQALRNVLLGLGAELDALNGPRLLACHVMVDGARTDHEQPIVGADMAISLADLALARCEFVACGHIHAQNAWRHGEASIAYPGTPRASNFGEPGPKGYIVVEFEGRAHRWERIMTPATPMLLGEDEWDGERWLVGWHGLDPDNARGAEIRLRYQVPSDHRDSAKRAAAAVRDDLIARGAVSVKVEECVIATARARSPEIATARTLDEKLAALWRARNIVPEPTRTERLLTKVHELEGEVAA